MGLLSDKETITSGEKITFPNGKYIYQHPSGPVEIGYGDKVLWMSDPEHNNVHSASTKLQGDANLLTRNQDGKRIWKMMLLLLLMMIISSELLLIIRLRSGKELLKTRVPSFGKPTKDVIALTLR